MRKKLLLSGTLMFFFFVQIFAQRTITGKITDIGDKPISNASVIVKGSNVGTNTDENGNFTITLPKGKTSLSVSSIGYEATDVNATGNTVHITLSTRTSTLNDVVVVGYSSQKKKDITGSVAIVNVKDLKASPAGNVEQMLQGQAAGLNVITSGSPGSNSQINIRGITSFGNNDPLVIVDGVQGNIHDLNPNDIESIQVLKDAGSAAIYGVQGANGVIVVTTKKGNRSGKATISYDGYVGVQEPLGGNVFNLLNSAGLMELTKQVNTRAGGTSQLYGTDYKLPEFFYNSSAGPHVAAAGDPAVDPSKYIFDHSNPANDYLIAKANQQGTDWFHQIFSPALQQSHTVSASGGSDKNIYFFSLNYLDQQGTMRDVFQKRYAARMNTEFSVKNNIRVGENAYVFYKQNPGQPGGNQNEGNQISYSYREQPIIPVRDIEGHYAGTFNGPELGNGSNPVADLDRTANNKANQWDIVGNVYGEVDFLKHFTARTQFGGTIDNQYSYNFSYNSYEDNESHTALNGFNENSQFNSNWAWTNSLTYSDVFAGDHSLKVFVASESKNFNGRGLTGSSNNFFSDDPSYWIVGNGSNTLTSSSYAYKNKLFSVFGRVDYAYKDKYLLSGTLRRDGASVLAPDVRYGNFPSVSLGWRLSQENFMKNVSWINELKLRGSWGKLGSVNNVTANNQFNLYGQNFSNSFYDINGTSNNVVTGYYQTQIGNPNAKWEQDVITNFGLDAVLFNNKITLSAEYYIKKANGLLFPDQLPTAGVGLGSGAPPYVNIGNIQNNGVDVSATYSGSVGREFHFNLGLSVTAYKALVKSVPGTGYFDAGGSRIGSFARNEDGHPVGAFFGYKVIGIFQDSNQVKKSPAQDGAAAGTFIYKDVNGDGKITPDDRTFLGNPNPKFTYGINLNANFRNFDFTAILYGSAGNDVVNYVKYWTDFYDAFAGNKSNDLLNNSWSPTNTKGTIPIAQTTGSISTDGAPNSFFQEKGSFLKCKSIILGYTISPTLLKRIGIDRFRIYAQVANLFTITKYSGLDPELITSGTSANSSGNNPGYAYSSSFGIDYGNFPNNQKSYILGVSLGF
jgi:TonB-dependent starch-binding outer membrane protein SusC